MTEKANRLSKQYFNAVLLMMVILGAFLTIAWYIMRGADTLWIPILIMCASIVLFVHVIMPKLKQLLEQLYPSKE